MTKRVADAFETGYQMGREHAIQDMDDDNAKLWDKIENQAREITRTREALECVNGKLKPWKKQADRLAAENAKLRDAVLALLTCENDDMDAHDCPMYDESKPNRCKLEMILYELGFSAEG